jgi:hypothetical protein
MIGFFLQRVEVNDYFHYKWYETRPAGSGYKDIWRNRVNINYVPAPCGATHR